MGLRNFLNPIKLWKSRLILFLIEIIIHYFVVTLFYIILISFNESIVDTLTNELIGIYIGFAILIVLQLISSIKTKIDIKKNKNILFIVKLIAKISVLISLLFSFGSYILTWMIVQKPKFVNEILNPVCLILEIVVLPLILFRAIITFEFSIFLAKDFRGISEEFPKSLKKTVSKELKSKPEERMGIESEIITKIKRMIKVSTRIALDRMQNALKMEKKDFDEKIFEWAEKFDFTIDGDYLIINEDKVSDFIDALDKQFRIWENKEGDKEGKI